MPSSIKQRRGQCPVNRRDVHTQRETYKGRRSWAVEDGQLFRRERQPRNDQRAERYEQKDNNREPDRRYVLCVSGSTWP